MLTNDELAFDLGGHILDEIGDRWYHASSGMDLPPIKNWHMVDGKPTFFLDDGRIVTIHISITPEDNPIQEEDEPPVEEYDPGPECDDEGGMSEYRYPYIMDDATDLPEW